MSRDEQDELRLAIATQRLHGSRQAMNCGVRGGLPHGF